jgi:hypothetical protein
MHPPLSTPADFARGSTPAPLVCPACDHANPAGARFCNECGVPVHLRPCPQCEAINDGSALQCHRCAALLLDAAPATPPRADDAGTLPTLFPNLAAVRDCPQCDAINDRDATFCYRCEAAMGDLATDLGAVIEAPRPDISPDPVDEIASDVAAAPPMQVGPAVDEPSFVERAGERTLLEPAPDIPTEGPVPRTPVHFIGGLSAPVDEAELRVPDERRWSGRGVIATMLGLLVIPAVAALLWGASRHPERLDQAVDRLRSATGALVARAGDLGLTKASDEASEATIPADAPMPAASEPAMTDPPTSAPAADGATGASSPEPGALNPAGAPGGRASVPARREPSATASPAVRAATGARSAGARATHARPYAAHGVTATARSTRPAHATPRRTARSATPQRIAMASGSVRCTGAAAAMRQCRPAGPFDSD